MTKERNSHKDEKKKATKTPKEKRAEKRTKEDSKPFMPNKTNSPMHAMVKHERFKYRIAELHDDEAKEDMMWYIHHDRSEQATF